MKKLRDILSRYKVHMIILMIAILIWFHAVTEKYYEQPFAVTVVPTNVHTDYVITNDYTKQVTVLFRGKGKNLLALMNTNIRVTADLKQTTQPRVVVQLSLDKIHVPPSLMELEPIKFVDKDTIHFVLEPLRRKRVVIVPRITVTPKEGFIVVGNLQIQPSRILITGPQSLVERVDSLETKKVQIENAEADVTGSVELNNPYPHKLKLEVTSVRYLLQVQKLAEKLVENVPVKVINAPANRKVSVIPPVLSLHLMGGEKVLANLGPDDIVAYVDYRRYLRTGEKMLPAIIEIPDNVTFDKVTPEKFKLVVE